MSRGHFLRVIGYFGIVSLGSIASFGSFVELYKKRGSLLYSPKPNSIPLVQEAYAQTTTGSWSLGQNTTVVAIHAALTFTGKILYAAGSSYCINTEGGPYTGRVLDPATGSETSFTTADDLFCSGAAQLANGNIFSCGGTKLYDVDVNNCSGSWHGANCAYEFNTSGTISGGPIARTTSMAQGRWYPTCVTLANGKVLIVSGNDDLGVYNYITEIYDPVSKSISIAYDPSTSNTYCVGSSSTSCPGHGSPCYGGPNQGTAPWLSLYPRMHLMPSGLVFASSPLQNTYQWDPSAFTWKLVNSTSQTYRDYGASILLPLQNTASERGKVLIVGGSTSDTTVATNVVEIEDFNQGTATAPVLRQVAPLNFGRKFVLPIILPNGKIVIFGGSSQGTTNPIYVPEMFDPENESQGWVTLPAATVARVYHGVALLMPDGSVWTASSTVNPCQSELRTEIFKPAYFSATRPSISGACTVGGYGQSITIPTPNPTSISRVSLVRLGATTHHFDTNVRLIWLQITGTSSNNITVAAPLNANLAPPGYYMIHVLDSSLTPSLAQIIQIPGSGGSNGGTAPAQVTGLAATTASSTQINLAWTANASTDNVIRYNIYRSTTAGFTVNTATDTPISTPATNSFSDTGLTASTTYYYVVAAVNNSGVIGPVSAQASGTTSTDTTPPTVSSTTPANGATGVPVNTTVTIIFSEQVQASTVTWQNIAFTDSSFNSVDRQVTLAADNITCTVAPVAALTAGTTYTVTVLTGVKDLAGNSMASNYSFSFTVSSSGATAPAQVTGLAATTASSTQINLAWTANASTDNVTKYNVYRSTTAGFTVNTATDTPIATPATNSFSDTGLTASTTYYYRVAAVNNSGVIGPVSAQASGTTAPAQVTGLAAAAASGTQINLAWTANTDPNINHYNIYRSTTAGFTVNTSTATPIATPATNSFSDTGLTASTTYYYRVAAVNNTSIIGTPSNIASATTARDTTPPTVTITSPANGATVPHGSVKISGTASDVGGSGLKNVQVKVNSGSFKTATLSGGNWSINVSLSRGNSQTITALATDNAGNISTPVTIKINVT